MLDSVYKYQVLGVSEPMYEVNFNVPSCSCMDLEENIDLCKHIFIVIEHSGLEFVDLPDKYLNCPWMKLDRHVISSVMPLPDYNHSAETEPSSSTHMSDEPSDDPPSTFTSSYQPLELARETLKRITSITYLAIPPDDQHLLHQDLLAMEHRLLALLPKKEGIALAAPKKSIRRLPRTAALPKKKRMCTRSFVMKPPEPSDPALDDQTCIVVSANVPEMKQSIKSNINI